MPVIQDLFITTTINGKLMELYATDSVDVDVESHITPGEPEIYRADPGDCSQGFPPSVEILSVINRKAIALYDTETDLFVKFLPKGTELVIDITQNQTDILAEEERDNLECMQEY